MNFGTTLFDKIWDQHIAHRGAAENVLFYVDRHFMHDGASRAFEMLAERKLTVRRPDRTFVTFDHYVPTSPEAAGAMSDPDSRAMIDILRENAGALDIPRFDIGDPRRGIVHVIGPEQGLTLPGMTIVCGDSHTATHGALGALAFGIGLSEVAHVLATQTLWQRRPAQMRITVSGGLNEGVTAKDLILAIIAAIGPDGASGHAVEYAGSAIRALSIEQRLTVCNMSIEAGARSGIIAPDETTISYIHGKPFSPAGKAWDEAVETWLQLRTDSDVMFDREIEIDGSAVAPMITWGTSPADATPVDGRVPDPSSFASAQRRQDAATALDYMGLIPGTRFADISFDQVFIGSCTNSRIEDLRAAASICSGAKAIIPAIVVPGSESVRLQAEAEGLDRIFTAAGFEWRRSGCSMCVGMNGDRVGTGLRCASTSNRNFPGRQGVGARTHLMSPVMAAAVALHGHAVDVRRLQSRG
ncbi:MAG: 3-isopropylmalate dehydratase large subunit [Pseudaminobacter sp.]